jgi:hypothetical protein
VGESVDVAIAIERTPQEDPPHLRAEATRWEGARDEVKRGFIVARPVEKPHA